MVHPNLSVTFFFCSFVVFLHKSLELSNVMHVVSLTINLDRYFRLFDGEFLRQCRFCNSWFLAMGHS